MNKQAWIARAAELGIAELEIYEELSEKREVTWFEGRMDTFVTSSVLGTSLRGIADGKTANLALEKVDDAKMDEALALLREQAAVKPSGDADELRAPEETEEVEAADDWVTPTMDEIAKALAELEKALAAADSRVTQVTELGWSEGKSVRTIVNSKGLDVRDGGRSQILYAGVAVSENGEVKSGYRVEAVRDLKKLDYAAFAAKAAEDAVHQLGAAPVQSGSYPVIFERRAMTSIFSALTDIFSGERIGQGISPLKDAADTAIFSDKITVADDPRCPDALSIANYDDEGCPTRRKLLVENGVFRQALHNTRSAKRMKTVSTGNGFKAGYASAVGIRPMNCSILPGEKSLEEMMKDMGSGLVITKLSGLHAGLNHTTTDFSLLCSGYVVENGERGRDAALITVAGNFLDLMKTVVDVGSDLEWEYHRIAAPSIRFASCAISGK